MSIKAKSRVVWGCLFKGNRWDNAPEEQGWGAGCAAQRAAAAALQLWQAQCSSAAGFSSGSRVGFGLLHAPGEAAGTAVRDCTRSWLLFAVGDHYLRAAC